MTKRDGDRLRAIKEELREMVSDYGSDTVTGAGLKEVNYAIDMTLNALAFEVRCTDPKTGAILPRHEVPESRRKSPWDFRPLQT